MARRCGELQRLGLILCLTGLSFACSRADFRGITPKKSHRGSAGPGSSTQTADATVDQASAKEGAGGNQSGGGNGDGGDGSGDGLGEDGSGTKVDRQACRDTGVVPAGVPSGEMIEITTVAELAKIASNKNYHLANDLDVAGAWDTLPDLFGLYFDGGNHKITGLSATRRTPGGLFGVLSCSQVMNLTLVAPQIALPYFQTAPLGPLARRVETSRVDHVTVDGGTVSGNGGTGGLVGGASGSVISYSSSSAAVSGAFGTGGLVGSMLGGVLTNSHASGEVMADLMGGGLVGGMTKGTISKSYATGDVYMESGAIGGLVGAIGADVASDTMPTVSDSFARGNVYSYPNAEAGGLIGYIGYAVVKNVYASGKVSSPAAQMMKSFHEGPWQSSNGVPTAGGLIGNNHLNLGKVQASHWDKETSGLSQSAAGAGETSDGMKATGTYAGWDFSAVWTVGADSYPALR